MAKLRYTSGDASVVMDDTLDRIYRRAINDARPGLLPVLDSEAARLGADAIGQWPVKTGRSRAAIVSGVRVMSNDRLESYVGNTSPYVVYIKGRAQGGKSAWQELIRKPGLASVPRLLERLADTMGDVLGGK